MDTQVPSSNFDYCFFFMHVVSNLGTDGTSLITVLSIRNLSVTDWELVVNLHISADLARKATNYSPVNR